MAKKNKQYHTSGGWAWQPNSETIKSLAEANKKLKLAKAEKATQLFANQEHSHMKTIQRIEKSKTQDKIKTEAKKKASSSAKILSKKTPLKKVSLKKGTTPPESDRVPLKKILPDGMDAKLARKKLRQAGWGDRQPDTKARWEFSENQVKEVLKLFKSA